MHAPQSTRLYFYARCAALVARRSCMRGQEQRQASAGRWGPTSVAMWIVFFCDLPVHSYTQKVHATSGNTL